MKTNSIISLEKELFTEIEFEQWVSLMLEINCTDFGDTPKANKKLDDLHAILNKRCEHWSGISHFVSKSVVEDHPTPWILYINDEYTGVCTDVEDLFEHAYDAAKRGLELEYDNISKFYHMLGNGDELRVCPAQTTDCSDNYTSFCVEYYFCENMPNTRDENFVELFGSAYQAYLFCVNYKDQNCLTLNNDNDELKNIDRQPNCTVSKTSWNFARKIGGIIRCRLFAHRSN